MATPEHGRFRSGLHLLGFGTLRGGVAKIAFGVMKVVGPLPGCNTYFDMIGKVFVQYPGTYFNRY